MKDQPGSWSWSDDMVLSPTVAQQELARSLFRKVFNNHVSTRPALRNSRCPCSFASSFGISRTGLLLRSRGCSLSRSGLMYNELLLTLPHLTRGRMYKYNQR